MQIILNNIQNRPYEKTLALNELLRDSTIRPGKYELYVRIGETKPGDDLFEMFYKDKCGNPIEIDAETKEITLKFKSSREKWEPFIQNDTITLSFVFSKKKRHILPWNKNKRPITFYVATKNVQFKILPTIDAKIVLNHSEITFIKEEFQIGTLELHSNESGPINVELVDDIQCEYLKDIGITIDLKNANQNVPKEVNGLPNGKSACIYSSQKKIKNLIEKNKITIPITLNLKECMNPNKDLNVKARISISGKNGGHTYFSVEENLKIKNNLFLPDLSVVLNWGDGMKYNLSQGKECNVDLKSFSYPLKDSVADNIKLEICAYKIEDIRCSYSIKGGKFPTKESDKLFLLSEEPENHISEQKNLTTKLLYSEICKYIDYNSEGERKLKIEWNLSFNFKTNSDESFKFYEAKIILPILVQNPEWYSIDFGTSAVVAARGREAGEVSLINLNRRRDAILKEALQEEDYNNFVDPSQDPGEPLISSSVSLWGGRDEKDYSVDREDITKYPILLAPPQKTSDQIPIPCLKTLVGYDRVPDILDTGSFEYYVGGTKTVWGQEDPLSRVDTIIYEVYKQLFRHYLCSSVELKEINKLVLSVPNTFTSRHHSLVKDKVYEICPHLQKNNISVVSESDAVACYYIKNRDILYPDRKVPKEEHVFVFDMGAGTLDLTYLIIKKKENGSGINVTIEGRLGICKAGDYIDYKLAEIYTGILKEQNPKDDTDKQLFYNRATLGKNVVKFEDVNKLKKKIRDEIKPNLFNEDYLIKEVSKNEEKEICKIKDIKAYKNLYEELINECTSDVLTKFLTILGTEKLPIDVLVLSGRSTGLLDIRNKVCDFVKEHNEKETYYLANLSSMKMVKVPNELEEQQNIDSSTKLIDLKTIVCKGGIYYADWIRTGFLTINHKKALAEYGVLLKNRGAEKGWDYQVLLSGNVSANSYVFERAMYSKVVFVQSYEPETLEAWKTGCKDMISVIRETEINECNNEIVVVEMEIDNDMNIICKIVGQGVVNATPHDDFNNENLRKSLWPVTFRIDEKN